ncbi:MAG: hypothetical protein AAF393_11770 [Pseudomonadota bacterium]
MRYHLSVRDLLRDGRPFDLFKDFEAEELTGLDFSDCPNERYSFAGSLFISCNFGTLDLSKCSIVGTRFEDCDLSEVQGLRECLASVYLTNSETTFRFDCLFPPDFDPEVDLYPAMLDRRFSASRH